MTNQIELSFKEAFGKLQNILEELESKDCDIEEMTKLYQKGLELKKYCSDVLSKEKNKIKVIAEKNNISLEEIGLSDTE